MLLDLDTAQIVQVELQSGTLLYSSMHQQRELQWMIFVFLLKVFDKKISGLLTAFILPNSIILLVLIQSHRLELRL